MIKTQPSKEELHIMMKEAEEISQILLKVTKILEEELFCCRQDKNKISFIDTSMFVEYEKLHNSNLHLTQAISIYHDWARRALLMITSNRGQLKSGILRQHAWQACEIVSTISKLLPKL